jgi:hypothetical protein
MKRKRSFFYISMTCSVLCFFSRSHAINSLGINCRVSLLGNIAVRTSADSSGLINYQMKDYNFFRPAGRWPELKNAVMTIKIIPDGDLDATRIHPSKQIPGLRILTLAEIGTAQKIGSPPYREAAPVTAAENLQGIDLWKISASLVLIPRSIN